MSGLWNSILSPLFPPQVVAVVRPVLKVPLGVLQLSLDLSSSFGLVTTNPGGERERERRLTEQTVKLGPERNDQLLPPLCFVGAKDPQMGYLLALPTKALKDIIVFRLILEYSSLRDFYRPLGNNNRSFFFLMSIFEQ